MGLINSIGSWFQKVPGGFTIGTQTFKITVLGNLEIESAGGGYEHIFPAQSGTVALLENLGIAPGTAGRIPYVNATNDGFATIAGVYFNATDWVFSAAFGMTINGSFAGNGYSAFFGEGHILNTTPTGGGMITDAAVVGNSNTIGDQINYFSGSTGFTYGAFNKNYGIQGFAGGNHSQVLHSGEPGGGLYTKGGFAVGLTTAATDITKWVTAGANAVNFSGNTVVQTLGYGALGSLSAILGGQDHHIPADSARVAIIGGNNIVARAASSDIVYVPALNLKSIAGDYATPGDGDIWYNTTLDQFRVRANGVTYSLSTGGGSSDVYNETPTGLVNGSNAVFTTAANFTTGKTRVYLNGLRQRLGGGNDYTETAVNQITFASAPQTGDIIIMDYN